MSQDNWNGPLEYNAFILQLGVNKYITYIKLKLFLFYLER